MRYSDDTIIGKLNSGNLLEEREALHQIKEQSFEMICIWICKNQGRRADAKDIYQEVITNLVQKVRSGDFVQKASLRTYNFSVARNLWLKELRKKRPVPLDTFGDAFVCTTNIEQNIIRQENEAIIHNCIGQLTERGRYVLQLHCFERKKMSEIAEIMGFKSEQVAKNFKYKTMKKLTRLVRKQFGERR